MAVSFVRNATFWAIFKHCAKCVIKRRFPPKRDQACENAQNNSWKTDCEKKTREKQQLNLYERKTPIFTRFNLQFIFQSGNFSHENACDDYVDAVWPRLLKNAATAAKSAIIDTHARSKNHQNFRLKLKQWMHTRADLQPNFPSWITNYQ